MIEIRNKIEHLYNEWKYGNSAEAKYRCEAYKELLEYLDNKEYRSCLKK